MNTAPFTGGLKCLFDTCDRPTQKAGRGQMRFHDPPSGPAYFQKDIANWHYDPALGCLGPAWQAKVNLPPREINPISG